MVLGIAEDFTSEVVLDSELKTIPSNGLYLNRGVHTSITLGNLLSFLPDLNITFSTWSSSITYNKYTTTNNKKDIVVYSGKIYQSLNATNLNQQPNTSTDYWLETNIESLRLKSFIDKVKDRVYSDLNLTKRLINNQEIYEVSTNKTTFTDDYIGWAFEPKGSDYVAIRLNQISIQKDGTTPLSLYVVNQGVLVDTLPITPSNGIVSFKDLNYTFKGKGIWYFVIDGTEVYTDNSIINPLKYDGFVAYTTVGVGATPQGANYNFGVSGNGLGFNITAYLDSEVYINNNINEFGNYIKATFEMMCFELFQSNSSNRSNRAQKIQMDDQLLSLNVLNLEANTIARRYDLAKKSALKQLSKTFDTQLFDNNTDLEIEIDSV
jgi:hypothetical protein